MNLEVYEQIVSLREVMDAQPRGYKLEQILREILPWDFRPPIAVSGKSEQIDAFFEWTGNFFLVEAKAKDTIITRGSSDWEDFELKLRRRGGGVIGLYCSLWSVNDDVYSAAKELNTHGIATVVLAGDFWDRLLDSPLPFSDLLRYCIFQARASFAACPKNIVTVKEWCYDRTSVVSKVASVCRKESATFLRRHAFSTHSQLYVKRQLDENIEKMMSSLKPSTLAKLTKSTTHGGKTIEVRRDVPPQICLLRDSSGAGKTMFSAQIALTEKPYFGMTRAALEPDIDQIAPILEKIGSAYGLQQLHSIDQPILYAVDSLDEADHVPTKRRECISLLRALGELNEKALKNGLLQFPVGLLFTVREDYWLHWQSVFEGHSVITFRQQFTQFTDPEFSDALKRYASTYKYTPTTAPTPEARRVLSIPFNLQVFSEAHEFEGVISFADVLPENVVHSYFTRKRDDIIKRQIVGLTGHSMMRICGKLAVTAALKGHNLLTRQEVISCVKTSALHLSSIADQVLLALVSDNMLLRNADSGNDFHFRHSRVIEYLVGYDIVNTVSEDVDFEGIDKLTSQLIDGGLISMYQVHECIKWICKRDFPALSNTLDLFYANSKPFMAATLLRLRQNIASGDKTSKEDIALVLGRTDVTDAKIVWDSFFVISAMGNKQAKSRVLDAFEAAWTSNHLNTERWKLLKKLSQHKLLLEESVFLRLTESQAAKEWEVYLGCILENSSNSNFAELWKASGINIEDCACVTDSEDWKYVRHLLDCLLNDVRYVRGNRID